MASAAWTGELADRKARKFKTEVGRRSSDAVLANALDAIRSVLQRNPDVYVVNEGANALDLACNTITCTPSRHRLDSGTWGVMGIGMGHCGRRQTGRPVVRSRATAHGFSGMEFETYLPIPTPGHRCHPQQRRRLPRRRGNDFRSAAPVSTRPSAHRAERHARHELIAEAFGGKGYHVSTPTELESALTEDWHRTDRHSSTANSGPCRWVESGHLAKLNTTSAATPAISGDG